MCLSIFHPHYFLARMSSIVINARVAALYEDVSRSCFWEQRLNAFSGSGFSEYQIGWNLKPDPSQHKCLLVHLPQDAAAQSHALLQTLLHSAASVWLFNFIYISLDTTCNSLSVASVKSSPIYEAMQHRYRYTLLQDSSISSTIIHYNARFCLKTIVIIMNSWFWIENSNNM